MSAVAKGTVGRTLLFAGLSLASFAAAGSSFYGTNRLLAARSSASAWVLVLGVLLAIAGLIFGGLAIGNIMYRRKQLAAVPSRLPDFQ